MTGTMQCTTQSRPRPGGDCAFHNLIGQARSVEFFSLGGTPSPRDLGVRGKSATRVVCGLGTQERGFGTNCVFWE